MFTEKDLKQFKEKNIPKDLIERQVKNFEKGFPYSNIIAPATVNSGLFRLSTEQIKEYSAKYEEILKKEKIMKFVPASGAASRMFKKLYDFVENYDGRDKFFEDKSFNSVYNFFKNIKKFAFYEDLKEVYKDTVSNPEENQVNLLKTLLSPKGLNYGNKPKALLKFHRYDNKSRTSVEEHLTEGANYGNSSGTVNIHFTVSEEHLKDFKTHISKIVEEYERKFNVKYDITYSLQKKSTDTIAVDLKNKPIRNPDGSILFRPGGHGALIENLNDLNADIIFVKNIDNVVPDRMKQDTYTYKKALGGLLVTVREKIYSFIKKIEQEFDDYLYKEIISFLNDYLFLDIENDISDKNNTEKKQYLFKILNRPVRVCGMVKNEGEPGGGPFFVKSNNSFASLQIVEKAQINTEDEEKNRIVQDATHFNPVDLVCSVKDYKGAKFDLTKFVDVNSGFIAIKSKDGKELKAQELPGLWNGAMAFWNTIFVEVPISTFNPVKIINDLIRPQHLQKKKN